MSAKVGKSDLVDITVVLLERALPSSSIAPIEIFSTAGVLWPMLHGQPPAPRFRVRTVSLDGRATKHFVPLQVQAEAAIGSIKDTDLIVLPTAELDLETSTRANAPLVPWIRRLYMRGANIAAICTGVSVVAEAGLLDGKPATTHWGVVEQFRQKYPRVQWQPERFVTESGRIFCGGGVYAAIDLSLYLVEKYCGHEVAVETAKSLLLESPRTWQSAYGTAPPRSAHDDDAIQKAQAWLFRNFKEEVRVEELAAKMGMSPRNFARRFTSATGETPLSYLHRLRIDAARHLLEAGKKNVAEVSEAVGYHDLAFFRRLFKRHTGSPPRAYRARFAPLLAEGRRDGPLVARRRSA
jgi:transcriptional regulator GlxA family with amidase domain